MYFDNLLSIKNSYGKLMSNQFVSDINPLYKLSDL